MTAHDKPMSAEGVEIELSELAITREGRLSMLLAWADAIRADERAKLLADADKLMANWCRASVIKLAAGEMTAQELRTAQAVVRAVRADLSRLAAFERQSASAGTEGE